MVISEIFVVGPDGAGRLELDAEALERLCRAYDLILTRAAQRRRELAQGQVDRGAPDGQHA